MEEVGQLSLVKACAIYARGVRKPRQSIEAQIELCKSEARRMGFQVPDHLIFRDEGRNRYLAFDERPGIKALLEAARSEPRQFDTVFVDANYRFSRPFTQMLSVYSRLSRAGITVRVANTSANAIEAADGLGYEIYNC